MTTVPRTANQVVDGAYITTTTNMVGVGNDLTSTDDLRRAIKANSEAIRRLADHIDGVRVDHLSGEVIDKGTKNSPVIDPVTGVASTPNTYNDPSTHNDPVTGSRFDPATGARVDKFGKPV